MAVVTFTSTVDAAAVTSKSNGATVNVHGTGELPACDTVNVVPAIVTLPDRADPEFAAYASTTDPLPVPDAPDAIWIQETLLLALHEQLAAALTVTS